jgi:segregation and condensation protein B
MTTEHEGAETNCEAQVVCELSECTPVILQEAEAEVVTEAPTSVVEASQIVDPSVLQISDVQAAAMLEALLLASGDALSLARIGEVSGLPKARIKEAADRLAERYSSEDSGIELVVVAEKLQLRTKAAFAEHVRGLMAVRPRKLSQAALETLAVIAYQQPVVKSEVDKIRGVDVAPTIKTLLERKLVKIIGYQASVGQPALYGTTEEFLQVFGLSSLSALPAMRDLKALVKEPGEAQQLEEEEGVEHEVEAPVAEPVQAAVAADAAAEVAPVQ